MAIARSILYQSIRNRVDERPLSLDGHMVLLPRQHGCRFDNNDGRRIRVDAWILGQAETSEVYWRG